MDMERLTFSYEHFIDTIIDVNPWMEWMRVNIHGILLFSLPVMNGHSQRSIMAGSSVGSTVGANPGPGSHGLNSSHRCRGSDRCFKPYQTVTLTVPTYLASWAGNGLRLDTLTWPRTRHLGPHGITLLDPRNCYRLMAAAMPWQVCNIHQLLNHGRSLIHANYQSVYFSSDNNS